MPGIEQHGNSAPDTEVLDAGSVSKEQGTLWNELDERRATLAAELSKPENLPLLTEALRAGVNEMRKNDDTAGEYMPEGYAATQALWEESRAVLEIQRAQEASEPPAEGLAQ